MSRAGGALFVPYLLRDQVTILREYWERGGVFAVGITDFKNEFLEYLGLL
jgi:hypothetical protein